MTGEPALEQLGRLTERILTSWATVLATEDVRNVNTPGT
jgi:hypothetical protein